MWPFSRRQTGTLSLAIQEAYSEVKHKPDKGQILNACTTDVDRRSFCLQWAGEARDAYYQGRRESIQDLLLSRDPRYKYMDAETRMRIGEMKWGKSLQAKEIIGLEQMYSRWAIQYAGGPGSS